MQDEVRAAMEKMRYGKAAGPDNITNETLAALNDWGIDFITNILNQIYDRANKSTRNAIFTFSMVVERTIEIKTDLYLYFIDYAKVFCKVKHSKLFRILSELDMDGKDLRIIRNLY